MFVMKFTRALQKLVLSSKIIVEGSPTKIELAHYFQNKKKKNIWINIIYTKFSHLIVKTCIFYLVKQFHSIVIL